MGIFTSRTWKEKRAYHKENAKKFKPAKGSKLTEEGSALRSQGYIAGYVAAKQENMYMTDKAGFKARQKELRNKKKAKYKEYLVGKSEQKEIKKSNKKK